MPRASRSDWKASSESATRDEPGVERLLLRGVGVELAVGGDRDAAHGQTGGEHRREPGEPAGEIGVRRGRVDDRAVVGGIAVLVPERGERPAHDADLGGRLGDLGDRRIAGVTLGVAQPGGRIKRVVEDVPPDALEPQREVLRLLDRGHRIARGGERRVHRPVHRQSLEGIRRAADEVEVAAEPTGDEAGLGRAHLPVMTGGEVRQVRVGVTDAREHGHLARVVELAERRRRRMPLQASDPPGMSRPNPVRRRASGGVSGTSRSLTGASTDSASMPPARNTDGAPSPS